MLHFLRKSSILRSFQSKEKYNITPTLKQRSYQIFIGGIPGYATPEDIGQALKEHLCDRVSSWDFLDMTGINRENTNTKTNSESAGEKCKKGHGDDFESGEWGNPFSFFVAAVGLRLDFLFFSCVA